MSFGKDIATYHLRLDRSSVFLPVVRDNDPEATITGRFYVTLARATLFKSIKVRLIGRLRIPTYGLFLSQSREEITFEETQTLAYSQTLDSFQLPAGDYEFAFEIPLSRVTLDTLVGPKHEYHNYRVEVIIARPGFLNRDFAVSGPVVIYRFPRVDFTRGSHAVEGCSEKGVQYYISIPDISVPHGATFPVECWFVPPSKGTRLLAVTARVVESHDLRFEATAGESIRYDTRFITWNKSYIVFEEKHDFARDSEHHTGDAPDDIIHQISIPVRLPRGVNPCLQSYRSRNIIIEHLLVLEAEFYDRDGRSFELLTEKIPLSIYMTPADPEGGDVVSNLDGQSLEDIYCIPPIYGKHELDRVLLEHEW
ncbi:hypothetical protein BDV12DRAFT_189972 [Aspergillus spectabilis]